MGFEKGIFIRVPLREWNFRLKDLVCDADRPHFEEIVKFCVEQKVSAVFLFINCKSGNFTCVGYMPIYEEEAAFKQFSDKFTDFEKSIFLGAFLVDDLDELGDEELMEYIKNRAQRHAYWNGEYAIMVLR